MLVDVLNRDFKIANRNKAEWLLGPIFFIIICTIFAISFSSDNILLIKISYPIILISVLLSLLISSDKLFKNDYILGTFDDYLINNVLLEQVILYKIFSHIILIFAPVIFFIPVLSIMYGLDLQQIGILIFILLISIPAIVFIYSISSAVTVSLPKGNLLLIILTMPLLIPILLFSIMSLNYFEQFQFNSAYGLWAIILSIDIILLIISPFICKFLITEGIRCGYS